MPCNAPPKNAPENLVERLQLGRARRPARRPQARGGSCEILPRAAATPDIDGRIFCARGSARWGGVAHSPVWSAAAVAVRVAAVAVAAGVAIGCRSAAKEGLAAHDGVYEAPEQPGEPGGGVGEGGERERGSGGSRALKH